MKISEFAITFCKENIYRALDCFEDSLVYDEVEEEYAAIQKEAYARLSPRAYLAFGRIPPWAAGEAAAAGTPALYLIKTLGAAISDWSSALFAQGNYMAGMLADAMADDYLFQMDGALEEKLVSVCREKGFGIEKRLEAPTGIGMEAQQAALEAVERDENTGISIKESFMYDPLKTVCQVYLLKEGSQEYNIRHNCRECAAISCKHRSVEPVRLSVFHEADALSGECRSAREPVCVLCEERQSIQQALTEYGIYVSAVCGGRGTCGKCAIRVLEGEVPATEADERFFTREQLGNGMRLACRAYPKTDCKLLLMSAREENIAVVADFLGDGDDAEAEQKNNAGAEQRRREAGKSKTRQSETEEPAFGVAVDIGTTTLAMQLTDLRSGEALGTYTALNRQRAYGADVISRILASNQGNGGRLRECVTEDLKKGLQALVSENHLEKREDAVREISIVGNTTMLHLLMGYSCETLGVFPFRPVNLGTLRRSWGELTGETGHHMAVTLLPGISTFVGADIAAGILACGMDRTEELSLLLDLGTNGEMALGNSGRMLAASAAAGPAFEGGNISCGMGSVAGAICNVTIEDRIPRVRTIQEKPPIGICGTGAVETVYELRKAGIIDETGLMDEAYIDGGFVLARGEDGSKIMFTGRDVREIQLAKAAIRAGIETLLLRFGVKAEQVKRIYVAGGFGYQMDFEKAIGIGLLPAAFAGRIRAVGNSSLNGALQYLLRKDAARRIERIAGETTEVSLSNDRDFNEKYMEYMYFE